MVQLLLLLTWLVEELILSLMMRLLLQVVLRLLVQKDMKAVVLITSYVDVLDDREILVNQDSTFLLKMIL